MLRQRKKVKIRKYKEMTREGGNLFRPISFEVYGHLASHTRNTVKDLSLLAPSKTGMSPAEFCFLWKLRLAVSLQIGNYRIVADKG